MLAGPTATDLITRSTQLSGVGAGVGVGVGVGVGERVGVGEGAEVGIIVGMDKGVGSGSGAGVGVTVMVSGTSAAVNSGAGVEVISGVKGVEELFTLQLARVKINTSTVR